MRARNRRLVTALTLAFVLAFGVVSRAQLPVTDALGLVQHIIQVGLQETIKYSQQAQAERLYKMSLRIAEWGVTLTRFVIHRDFMPEWRIHNWFTADVLYAKRYHWALTYGDRTGNDYESTVYERRDADGVLAALPEAGAADLRATQALLDLVDSAIVRDTYIAGAERFAGRVEAEAIDSLQDMVTDEDKEQGLAAILDKVTAADIIRAQNKQTAGRLATALLEQSVIEQQFERDIDVQVSNRLHETLTAAQDKEGRMPTIVGNATSALSNWRLSAAPR